MQYKGIYNLLRQKFSVANDTPTLHYSRYFINLYIPLSWCSFASFSNRGWSTLLIAFRSVLHDGRLCFCVRIHCLRASFQEAALSSELLSLIVLIVLNDNPKNVHSCCHLAASELQAIATSFQSSSPEMKCLT